MVERSAAGHFFMLRILRCVPLKGLSLEESTQSKSLQAQTLRNTERCKAHEIRAESVKPQLKAIRDCGII